MIDRIRWVGAVAAGLVLSAAPTRPPVTGAATLSVDQNVQGDHEVLSAQLATRY